MLGHGRSVGSLSDSAMGEPPQEADFSARLVRAFQSDIIIPLMTRAGVVPAEARALIQMFRDRLETLESLLSPDEGYSTSLQVLTNGHAPQLPPPAAITEAEEIGRNQRSRIRELALLSTLESEHNALPLQQIMRALTAAGFDDTSAAIVSQLHRLKKLGVIAQPANGMYALTQEGVMHVRDLRKNFGHLAKR